MNNITTTTAATTGVELNVLNMNHQKQVNQLEEEKLAEDLAAIEARVAEKDLAEAQAKALTSSVAGTAAASAAVPCSGVAW